VFVGAQVDLHVLNPLEAAHRSTLVVGALLIVVAVAGKILAGYAPFWFRGRKIVIGVGMVPRGEVGLIFAQAGRQSGVLDAGFYQVPEAQWETGSSPVLHDGIVVIQADVQKGSFLAAFDASNGRELWRQSRSDVPTWSTPTR